MRIGKLTNRHRGQVVYVVGTGPSLRLVPPAFFKDKVTIGLNQAWKFFPPTYSLTVHPELVLEWEKAARRPKTAWAVKIKPPMDDLTLDDKRYYAFHTREDWGLFVRPAADTLFIGRGVQQTGLDLAARMGAAAVVLVGVDMGELGGEHHGHQQHVQFHGLAPKAVYAEYRAWTRKARDLLHPRVAVLSLSPCLGVFPDEDYRHLLRERGLKALPKPPDVSAYDRAQADLSP